MGTFLKDDGNPYTIYTPFKNKVKKNLVEKKINKMKIKNLVLIESFNEKFPNYKKNPKIIIHGGRKNGLKQLSKVKKNLKKYNDIRNLLSEETSLLSAYIKFGLVSIREVFLEFKLLKNN